MAWLSLYFISWYSSIRIDYIVLSKRTSIGINPTRSEYCLSDSTKLIHLISFKSTLRTDFNTLPTQSKPQSLDLSK